jgi:hypothetical protein
MSNGLLNNFAAHGSSIKTGHGNFNKLFDFNMERGSNTSKCSGSEHLKQLALQVRQGRFFEVQDWLAAGKPFRPISYRSAFPPLERRRVRAIHPATKVSKVNSVMCL